MWWYTPGLLQSHKSDLDDEIDEGFWLRYMLSTWLRQVVDELAHIHEVYSWWCWYILMSSWNMIGTYLVHGWMHLFMVQVDYRLVHGWCMVQIYWYRFTVIYLIVIVWQWSHYSTSTSERLDGTRTGGCSHLLVAAGKQRKLVLPMNVILKYIRKKFLWFSPALGFHVKTLVYCVCCWGKDMNYITQEFLDFSWLKKTRWECHPMFIAIKINILTHKY